MKMKRQKTEATTSRRNKALAALTLALFALAGLAGPICGEKPQEGESKAQQQVRLIKEKLALPGDAKFREAKVMMEDDALVLRYGTKTDGQKISSLVEKSVPAEKVIRKVHGVSISVEDDQGRVVTYAWFDRDPDLHDFPVFLDIAVSPLPGAIKEDPNI